ncbi:hypothetical protein [Thermosipho sp. 1074]|uniref:hypothetical protein n=1 Tax=Thermosipho sp. 1074 TaxID=1643331 RepID=UPI000985B2BC|nr:hypothetical protein [Thermosipho sp. 1074]OOC42158.1 hypothetical protein XO08_07680 [Thermosipho sp. 1074]
MKKVIFVMFGVLLLLSSCATVNSLDSAETGKIVFSITFPQSDTIIANSSKINSIPSGTTYLQITLKEENSTSWVAKEIKGLPGETVQVEFNVAEGTYTIDALTAYAPEFYYVINGFVEATGVNVVKNQTTYVTLEIQPITWNFSSNPTEAFEGESVQLQVLVTGPKTLIYEIMANSFISLSGSLENAISSSVNFSESLIEISEATATLRLYSSSFELPQVDSDTTYDWYLWNIGLDRNKWINSLFVTDKQYIKIKNQSSNLIVIIK